MLVFDCVNNNTTNDRMTHNNYPQQSHQPTIASVTNTRLLRQNDIVGMRKCILVTYPGIVHDTEKALQRLGGIDEVFQVRVIYIFVRFQILYLQRHHSVGTLNCSFDEMATTSTLDPQIETVGVLFCCTLLLNVSNTIHCFVFFL